MSCWRRWPRFVEVTRGKAAEWDEVVKTGRTHLQDAVPIRLGAGSGRLGDGGSSAAATKFASRPRGLRRLGIGGTAAGTGLNAHPEYHRRMVAKLTALTRHQPVRER